VKSEANRSRRRVREAGFQMRVTLGDGEPAEVGRHVLEVMTAATDAVKRAKIPDPLNALAGT
jgi:hypothetical protein